MYKKTERLMPSYHLPYGRTSRYVDTHHNPNTENWKTRRVVKQRYSDLLVHGGLHGRDTQGIGDVDIETSLIGHKSNQHTSLTLPAEAFGHRNVVRNGDRFRHHSDRVVKKLYAYQPPSHSLGFGRPPDYSYRSNKATTEWGRFGTGTTGDMLRMMPMDPNNHIGDYYHEFNHTATSYGGREQFPLEPHQAPGMAATHGSESETLGPMQGLNPSYDSASHNQMAIGRASKVNFMNSVARGSGHV